ncbi:hypothetical protein HPP92_013933 [Vanilla planifolia]|uniref:Protein downstream neighbor of Son n=1 Tax=Vanilla planifolia TaxID=51239 RepID=A0A835QYP5_VANPL|nr:hypothetical protein HPP92_013933 [Vanilla planifolia]
MAKAAVFDSSSSAAILPHGRAQIGLRMKRKTPSELRGEQLKRKKATTPADDQFDPSLPSERPNVIMNNEIKKTESAKVPRYVNMRVDEVYPVRKSSERCRLLSSKDKAKDIVGSVEESTDLDMIFDVQNLSEGSKASLLGCKAGRSIAPMLSDSFAEVVDDREFRKIEKCSQNALRNVVEVHLGNEKLLNFAKVDMEKALKGLAAHDKFVMHNSFIDSSAKNSDIPSTSSSKLFPEFCIPGDRAPLDFTLKTSFRLVSSSSIKWCHRLDTTAALQDIGQSTSKHFSNFQQHLNYTPRLHATSEVLYSKALHTWSFPQSSLPSSIIAAMALSSTKGEANFLSRRQQDWEDSFRSLYYMLRKSICNIFYVYSSQFIVLFICDKSSRGKQSCNAYISQSTHGLRALLRNHDVSFSMPLCHVEVQQATEADLVELSEIEKRNLGQTFHQDTISGVDNSSQSLLAFIGNDNVHCLYDFLLNYRSYLNSLSGCDVPTLYAPVPFQNASLCIPKVQCKEMRRANTIGASSSDSEADAKGEPLVSSAKPMCYSIEVKDTILPPWIICRLCAAMSSDGTTFESTFSTDPLSLGLNIALDSFYKNTDTMLPQSGDALGLPEAVVSPRLQSASLKRLKYCKGFYTAVINEL